MKPFLSAIIAAVATLFTGTAIAEDHAFKCEFDMIHVKEKQERTGLWVHIAAEDQSRAFAKFTAWFASEHGRKGWRAMLVNCQKLDRN